MKLLFKSEISGTALFKKILMYLLAYIICFAGMVAMLYKEMMVGYYLISIILSITLFAIIFQFIESVINSISVNNENFLFTGKFHKFMVVTLKNYFLTVITLGIYYPWFLKNIISYLTSSTLYKEKEITFNSKGSTLFKYCILYILLPVIALVAMLVFFYVNALNTMSIDYGDQYGLLASMSGVFVAYFIGIFIIAASYLYVFYKWFINFSYGDKDIKLEVRLTKTITFVLGQYFLTLITLGIYAVAAQIKVIKFFINGTKAVDRVTFQETPVIFSGKTSKGFGLIWGQLLLTLITCGIYSPWAWAKITNWYISNIQIGEDSSESDLD